MTLTHALRHTPPLIRELRTRLEPGRGGTERRAPGYSRQAPLAIVVMDDADDLYAALHEHAACIADELGTRPPKAACWASRGIPAGMTPDTAHHHARALARFIEHQHPLIPDRGLRDDIEHDLVNRFERVAGRYPLTPDPERIDARCAGCGRLDLYQHPPQNPGDDETYKCHRCHRWATETEIVERRAARERELKAKRKGAA